MTATRAFLIGVVIAVLVAGVTLLTEPTQADDHPPHPVRLTAALPSEGLQEAPGSHLEGLNMVAAQFQQIADSEAQKAAQAAEAAALAAEQAREAARVPEPEVDLPVASPSSGSGSMWDAVAQCETGGNWQMTGSSYSGGLGFYNGSWLAYGGGEFASNAGSATREQQIIVAERIYADNGHTLSGAWGCDEGAIG